MHLLRPLVCAACLCAGIAAPPAAAAKEGEGGAWTPLATTARKKVLLQYGSIRPHGPFVEAWSRYDYAELQNDVGKVPFRSSRYLADYDCKGGREKMRRVVSSNGPLEVHDLDIDRHTPWTTVGKPTTVSGIVHEAVCARAARLPRTD